MGVPGNADLLLLKTAAAAGGYQVSRSLRFNSADSAYLSRTPASAGNRKTWSFSFWLKRATLGTDQEIIAVVDGDGVAFIRLTSGNLIRVFSRNPSVVTQYDVSTVAVLRDCSAWYHILVVQDTTQAASGDRVKIYINGALQTLTTATAASLNTDCQINAALAHNIGNQPGSSVYLSAYLADVWFLDGIAATPSDFAETDATTGQWIPKTYSGSKGSNGFHLEFADNSAATATTLGKDTSGNGNNWTPNNFSVSSSTINYSNNSQVTGSYTSGWTAGYDPEKMFDGNLNTYTDQVDTGSTGAAAYLYWNPSSAIGVSSLRIYGSWYKSGQSPYLVDDQVSINGNPYVGNAGAAAGFAWWDLTSYLTTYSITSITNITFKRTPTSGNRVDPNIAAVEVNGSILTNSTAAGCDVLVDTPTSVSATDTGIGGEIRGNYCTLNPLTAASGFTLSNGNLEISSTSASVPVVLGTIAVNSGKWYWEVTLGTTDAYAGAATITSRSAVSYLGAAAGQFIYNTAAPASSQVNGSTYNYSTASACSAGDVIGVALNFDSNTITFYRNGVSQGTFSSNVLGTDTWAPAFKSNTAGASETFNFGQRPFAYTAPSGFKALCDTNLPAPVVAKPNTVMDVKLYTGNGSTQTVSGLNFSPDWIWFKQRNTTRENHLYDSVRGVQKALYTDLTNAEATDTDALSSFNSDGWTMGADGGSNQNGGTYVAWCWDAGSSAASTNNSGSIQSTVKVNTSAGFSIVTWSSTTGVPHTFGHGLGVAPKFVIVKRRSSTGSWAIGHTSLGWTTKLAFDTSAKAADDSAYWSNTAPTSTVISIGDASNIGGDNIAYCWAPVAGYSSFGSYTGNGSTDGPFVFCGFRPRWILRKRTDTSGPSWRIIDTARNPYNLANEILEPNTSDATENNNEIDVLSNGFKVRSTDTDGNANGGTIIYAAFAENPFAYARAR